MVYVLQECLWKKHCCLSFLLEKIFHTLFTLMQRWCHRMALHRWLVFVQVVINLNVVLLMSFQLVLFSRICRYFPGSMALMDAGVPLQCHVAGVSIGLIIDDTTSKGQFNYCIITDLLVCFFLEICSTLFLVFHITIDLNMVLSCWVGFIQVKRNAFIFSGSRR